MRHTALRARRWVLRELARLGERRPAQPAGPLRPSSTAEPGSDGGPGEGTPQGQRGGRPQTSAE